MLLRRSDLQFDLGALAVPKPPDWLMSLFKLLGAAAVATAPFWKILFWIGLALIVALLLFLIGREVVGAIQRRLPKRAKAKPAAQPEWRPAQARAIVLLEDADRLADQGRFAEAVHLILFRSIEDIDGHWPNLIKPALTSRDIADQHVLPESARRTFADIARMVERSFFGGDQLGSADFDTCRRAYEAFALPARPRAGR